MGSESIRIGVSACLLGSEVRFDGQHKRDGFLADELAPFVEYVPICPEVEVGMGVPRESVRLVRGPTGSTLMLGNRSGEDWTERMNRFAEARVRKLEGTELCGYVLKKNSPSCGMERVKLYDTVAAQSAGRGRTTGLFAAALMKRFPNLPVEEEGRLHDPALRENFIERVFAYHRVRGLWRTRWKRGDLVAFHTAHKMALLAHSVDGYRALGRLVARVKETPRTQMSGQYEAAFMAVLTRPATRARHTNVLMHMFGHVTDRLDDHARRELLGVIEDYRRGIIPLVVPVTLLRHHARRLEVTYLLGQSYLEPHPKELMLRNRV